MAARLTCPAPQEVGDNHDGPLARPIVNFLGRQLTLSPFTRSIGAPLDLRGGPSFSRSEARRPAESMQLGSLESRRTSWQRQTAPG